MIELELLKRFILQAPASHAEHQEALRWLETIVSQLESKRENSNSNDKN